MRIVNKYSINVSLYLMLFPLFFACPDSSSAAEKAMVATFKLVDGTQLLGELQHYYHGVFDIETKEGTIAVPREKVLSISFETRPARKEFASPEDTFTTWLKALQKDDLTLMTECYGLVYQNIFAMQMQELSVAERREPFSIFLTGNPKVLGRDKEGNAILLRIEVSENDKKETLTLKFIDEAGEWKMYPAQ